MIEILIAVIVLMIGLVGILALFPVGIASTKETEEDSNAAIVADSVCQALQAGMRMPEPGGPTDDISIVKISHDGLPLHPDSNECIYTFGLPVSVEALPPSGPRLFAHPLVPDPDAETIYYSSDDTKSEPEYAFRLGNNPAIKEVYEEVISGPDSTDPYTQYGFAFTVMRVDDLDPDISDPDRRARPLFEFKIYVYRLPVTEEIKVEELKGRKPKQVFTVQISGL